MTGNLYADLPELPTGELFEPLLRHECLLIERISSSASPEPDLYDQAWDEWVCLLRGEAELWIEGETITMHAGDYRLIPAHTRHRVLKTSAEPSCLWLAIHIKTPGPD